MSRQASDRVPSSAPLDAVVAGYVGVDLAPAFPSSGSAVSLGDLLRPGKLVEVGPLEITPGGVVPNTGLAMSAFGNRVALAGLVGDDRLGDLLLEMLAGHGAELHLQRSEAGTAYGLVLAPPGTDRVFLECPGCNAQFGAEDVDYELVARSRLFHFGYPPLMPRLLVDDGEELAAMLSRVRGLGTATSLDMTLPDPDGPAGQVDWRRLLARVLPHVDIFAPSLEELLYMLAPDEWARLVSEAGEQSVGEAVPDRLCEDLAAEAVGLGCAVVLVKAGPRGACCRTGGVAARLAGTRLPLPGDFDHRSLWFPAMRADPRRIVNACGAGDGAVAGFLTGLLKGESLEVCGRAAMLAGRDSLYGVDTTSGLTSWAGVVAAARGAS